LKTFKKYSKKRK